MLESFPIAAIVGLALGYLAGLGVGGGSLLILWLTLVLGMEHSEARLINLLFFLPSACTVSFFRCRQGNLFLKPVIPAIITGCAAAAAMTWFSRKIDVQALRKLFGILLLLTGIRELFYRPRKAK